MFYTKYYINFSGKIVKLYTSFACQNAEVFLDEDEVHFFLVYFEIVIVACLKLCHIFHLM